MQTESWLSNPRGGGVCEPQLGLEQTPPFQKELDFFFLKSVLGGSVSGLESQI